MELMLPPVPGTNEPHPAFWLNGKTARMTVDDVSVNARHPVAAAAAAHYWRMHSNQLSHTPGQPGYKAASMQCAYWSAIASGSREYDNCKIVAYEPRG